MGRTVCPMSELVVSRRHPQPQRGGPDATHRKLIVFTESAGPASRRWPSTRSTPRGGAIVESLSAYARQLSSAWKARTSTHRGHRPGHRDPPEEQHPQSPLDRRHDHRDSRLLRLLWRASAASISPQCGKEVERVSGNLRRRHLALPAGHRLMIGFDWPDITAPVALPPQRRGADEEDGAESDEAPTAPMNDEADRRRSRRSAAARPIWLRETIENLRKRGLWAACSSAAKPYRSTTRWP